jgi:hypothetical protein
MPEPVLLTATGAATVLADAWLTWPPRPRIPPTLEDLWFYGATQVKSMPLTGAARAGGEAGLLT